MTPKELADRISVNPKICHGRPCIKGTRVMVAQVLDLLSEGVPAETITSGEYFRDITKEDVLACVALAN